ncbi:MAG: hypothetical protein LBQ66_08095 [Planctomycetaceae bacterium]|jgi:hypothetical protein|nr:hypothetical protein [Planctomycetaceae bacterium]
MTSEKIHTFNDWIRLYRDELMSKELREIFDYEISHGNTVEEVYMRGKKYWIVFKLPLRFAMDDFINKREIHMSVKRSFFPGAYHDEPYISYSCEKSNQCISSPISYTFLEYWHQKCGKVPSSFMLLIVIVFCLGLILFLLSVVVMQG